jgi:hypothetical protein
MTLLEIDKGCTRILRLCRAPCSVRVLPEGKRWGGSQNDKPSRLTVTAHIPTWRHREGRFHSCLIVVRLELYENHSFRLVRRLLLRNMLHEIAHHCELDARHRSWRFRARLAALARRFGLTLKDCLWSSILLCSALHPTVVLLCCRFVVAGVFSPSPCGSENRGLC